MHTVTQPGMCIVAYTCMMHLQMTYCPVGEEGRNDKENLVPSS